MSDLNRRQAITAISAAAFVSASGPQKTFAANDTIQMGIIGCGGRARGQLMPALKKIPGVKMVAVCDVYDDHLEAGRFVAGDGTATMREYEALLARPDVDAVLIATPDHWHVPITVAACSAGKDVYCEKPLTHKLAEGKTVVEAQNKFNRIVQVGTQQRSMPHLAQARELVRQGALGQVRKVRMSWNRNAGPIQKHPYNIPLSKVDWKRFCGNAPEQPYDAFKMRNWRWFWDFGGGILTDLMVHWLDTVNWMLDLGAPASATTIGDHFAAAGVWETPDTIQTLLHYPDKGVQVYFEGTFVCTHQRAMTVLMGTDASLYFDRGRFELLPEPNREVKAQSLIVGNGERGLDFYDQPDGELLHLTSFIECVRSRAKSNTPAEAGVAAAAASQMANLAYREGRVVKT